MNIHVCLWLATKAFLWVLYPGLPLLLFRPTACVVGCRRTARDCVGLFTAEHQPPADHILERFEIFRSMVPWFDVQSICDCSAVQSAVCLSKCLAAAPVFLLGATRHFVLLSCKICAEIVVYRMLAVFLNGLNGKNSSRRIVRNIFSVYFFYSGFKISYSEYSFVTQIVISVIRIVSYISERHVLYIYLTCE